MKNNKGFTLIELIIVMSIIGVLAVVGIISISGKAQDARNAKRKADVSTILTAMQAYCVEVPSPQSCNNDGNNTAVLSTCSSPGSYIKLTTLNDPTNDGKTPADRCSSLNTGCNYTLVLRNGKNEYNQCDPRVVFALEDKGDWKSGCGRTTGIEFNLNAGDFDSCITGN